MPGEIARVVDEVSGAQADIHRLHGNLPAFVVLPLLAEDVHGVIELIQFVEDAEQHLHAVRAPHLRVGRAGGQAREQRFENVFQRIGQARQQRANLAFELHRELLDRRESLVRSVEQCFCFQPFFFRLHVVGGQLGELFFHAFQFTLQHQNRLLNHLLVGLPIGACLGNQLPRLHPLLQRAARGGQL